MDRERPAHREVYQVALCDVGDRSTNTLQLIGYDVVVPLEMDLDGDPLQDDRVRLVADTGRRVREVSSSAREAERDDATGTILYHFRDVPPGVYHVETFIRGGWYRVVEGLTVRQKGVFLGATALTDEAPSASFDAGEHEPDDDATYEEGPIETLDWHSQGGED